MKRLIVNADDFALTRQVSEGILDAHADGIVTSTTLLANGEAFGAASEMLGRAPHLGVGVHLALVQGVPVSPPSEIPTLVDARGRFWWTAGEFLKKTVTRRINLHEVEIELRRQIVRVLGASVTPTHLDGHKHLHVLPGIAEIVIRLAQEFGIPSVRCPMEDWGLPHGLRKPQAGVFKQYLAGRAISWFARRFRSKLAQAGLKCPAHFYGLSQTGFLNEESLAAILRGLPEGTSELMCHPGYTDSILAKTGTRLLTQREIECRALMSNQIKELAIREGIQFISYGEFAHAAQRNGSTAQDAEVRTVAGCARPV